MSCKAKLFTFLERVAFIKKRKYFVVVTYWLALHLERKRMQNLHFIGLRAYYNITPWTSTNFVGKFE
jgi:hypothetical protein